MQEKLGHEGWRPNANLPKGWLLRRPTDKNIKLFTREGNVLFSYKEATEYMSSLSYYSAQDLLKLGSLVDETLHEQKQKQTSTRGWKERQGLPPGWKAKDGKTINLLSPSGKRFFGTRNALQHMVNLSMRLCFDILFSDCQWIFDRGYQADEGGTELGWLDEGGGPALGLEGEKIQLEQSHFLDEHSRTFEVTRGGNPVHKHKFAQL